MSSDKVAPAVPATTRIPTHECIGNLRTSFPTAHEEVQIIPTSSLAAQVYIRGQTPAKFVHQAIPSLSPGELLVRLSHSGVCATDYATYSGALGKSDGVTGFVSPHVGGHEGIGTIVAVGSAVKTNDLSPKYIAEGPDANEFVIGQRVGIRWISKTCEKCTYCRIGRGDLCAFQRMASVHEHGTFQQFCRVHTSCAVRIPESVSAENAAAMMCAGSAAHTAVKVTFTKSTQEPH